MPPVEVAAAMLPLRSSATAPTVSCEIVVSCRDWARTDRCRLRCDRRACFGLVFAQALDFARDDQVFIVAECDAVLGGESFGAFGDEINVRTLAENFAGGAHGIAQALDASHAAGAERGAVHDEGVELDFAVAVEEAAASGVEGLVVFHDDDGFLDGVERRAAALEHAPSRSQRVGHAVDVGVDHVIGHGPRATMNDENGISWQELSLESVSFDAKSSMRLDRIAGAGSEYRRSLAIQRDIEVICCIMQTSKPSASVWMRIKVEALER